MLKVIVLVFAFVVITIYGVYYYQVKQRKKTTQAIAKKRLVQVERVVHGFKADLERLTEMGVLSEQAQEAIYRLARCYFVSQPATAESVEQCETVLKNLLLAIRDKLQNSKNNNPVYIRLHLDHFARSLPRTVEGYNAKFYQKKLPKLIEEMADAEGVIDD